MKTPTTVHTPGQNWPWIGQARLGAALLTMLEKNQWPATAMFVGSANLGKSTIARWFAQRDLCKQRGTAPCGNCRLCLAVVNGSHPDCLVIEPDDAVRLRNDEVQATLHGHRWKQASTVRQRRWIVLTDVDRLGEHIGNTLLKLIEEPPPATVILLTSSQPDRVLPTILSRAVQFRWQRTTVDAIDQALQAADYNLSPALRRLIAVQAGGRPGLALQLARHPQMIDDEWAAAQEFLQNLENGLSAGRTEWSSQDLDRGERVIRDVLLVAANAPARHWPDQQTALQTTANRLGVDRILAVAQRLVQRQPYLRHNVQPSFFVHDLVL